MKGEQGLNRAERRRQNKAKLKTDKTINIKQSEVDKIKQDAKTQGIDEAFRIAMAMPLMVLHDKYEFGSKRCEDFIDHVFELYDSLISGYITFNDMQQTILDELGINLVIKER